MLFVAFLSLHKHIHVRTNFVIDIAVTKNSKAKNDDNYDYKKTQKA